MRGRSWSRCSATPRGPRIGDVLEGLITAGDKLPGDLYHQAFEKPAGEPALILACNRRRQGLPPHPFLVEVAPRILNLAEAGVSGTDHHPPEAEKIFRLEKLRFSDRQECAIRLERFVKARISRLEGSGLRSPRALSELSIALSALAAVYRSSGRLDDALDALLLAHPLNQIAEDPLAEGIWFRKAGYLLSYLGRGDRAYEFIQEAATRFIEADAREEQAKALVDLGFVLSKAGRGDEACRQLKRALKVLAGVDKEYLFAAHQILAWELSGAGRVDEAIGQLDLACAFTDDMKWMLGVAYWGRARLRLAEGKASAAVPAYRDAIRLHKGHGTPADVAELAFEYAALLVDQKNRLDLEKLAAEVADYFADLECDSRVREAIEDFVAIIHMKSRLSPRTLKNLREKIAPSRPTEGGPPDPLMAQPPGGNCPPISSSSAVSTLLFDGKWPACPAPSTAG